MSITSVPGTPGAPTPNTNESSGPTHDAPHPPGSRTDRGSSVPRRSDDPDTHQRPTRSTTGVGHCTFRDFINPNLRPHRSSLGEEGSFARTSGRTKGDMGPGLRLLPPRANIRTPVDPTVTHTHARARAHTHTRAPTHTYTRPHTCVHARTRPHTHVHVHTRTHTLTPTRVHVHLVSLADGEGPVSRGASKVPGATRDSVPETQGGLPFRIQIT